MQGKFEVKKAKDGEFYFHLKAHNGQIIFASQRYKSKESALHGIESVKKNSHVADHFHKLTAKDGRHYFTLKAANHEVIGDSQMYESESARENGIESVMTNAPTAEVDDLTHQ
jgi:uncharacterized protein